MTKTDTWPVNMSFYYRGNFFETHEQKYDYYSDEDLHTIIDCLPPFPPEGSMLDLACGSGIIGEYFKSHFSSSSVFGTDICLPLLKWACFDKCQSDASYLPFNDNSFDCIIAVAAFHHFPDIGMCIKECWRCLKPDGTFLALEPNKFHAQRFVMMTNPLRHIFYKSGDHAISALRFKKMLLREKFDEIKINYIALKGKNTGIVSRLNYKVASAISSSRLKGGLSVVSPWFIVAAVKKK